MKKRITLRDYIRSQDFLHKPEKKRLFYELRDIADMFLQRHFNIPKLPNNIQIKIDTDAIKRFGQFRPSKKEIGLSKALFLYYPNEIIIDIFKHELIHFALHHLGKPYLDEEETFKQACYRVGIGLSGTYAARGALYQLECQTCEGIYHTSIDGYENEYICGRCEGDFELRHIVEIDEWGNVLKTIQI